jgi:hypothetical protein
MKDENECPTPDTHGQFAFNYHHPHITGGRETEYVLRAFRRDLEVNGPSIVRVVRTTLAGWQRYKNHPDPRIRRRFEWGNTGMATTYAAVVAATRCYYRRSPSMRDRLSRLLGDLFREFGWMARLYAAVGGPYVHWTVRREERRLSRGWTYEPPTFYEHNDAAHVLHGGDGSGEKRAACVTPRVPALRDQTPMTDESVGGPAEQPVTTTVDA